MSLKPISLKLLTFAFTILFGHSAAQEPCLDWENPTPNNGWNEFNMIFGGAPSNYSGDCPMFEIDAFELWAGEAYELDSVVAGNSYTFSHCNGAGAGSWVAEYTIIAPSGEVDAFGAGNLNGCSVSWYASESGTYLIVINEAGACGSLNTVDNGYPAISCGYLGGQISGKVFADLDCNGAFDSTDYPLSWNPVFRNGEVQAYSNSLGNYSMLIQINETVEMTTVALPGYTVNSHSLYLDSVQIVGDIDFALCPQSDFVNLSATISPASLPPRPGFEHTYALCIKNLGAVSTDAEVVIDISDLPGNSLINSDGGNVSGLEITWTLNQLEVFDQTCFYVTFLVEQGTPIGTLLNPVLSVHPMPDPSAEEYPEDNLHSYTDEVVAAYDPNDKTVSQTIVNHTEIEPGEGAVLEYLIRFQNTGNFFATFVRVEDMLPDLLDLNTLEMIHASHDYEINIHEGQHIEWFFDNIMLPDSTTDEPGSHGHIHFRIKTVPDVQLEDVIENTASIFFDFKEPIITEPAITTFMDCSEGSLSVLGLEPVCPGEPITLTTNRPEFDILWSTESGTSWGAEYYLNAPNEPIEITVTASHPVCTLITTVIIPVSEVPETEINVEDNQLVATSGESYAWYLDGELIDWATQQWIVPFENGTYTVEVEYENGCMGTAEILYQSVGINSLNQVDILLVPNPARDITQLILPEGNWQVSMIDVTGKLIFSEDQVTVNRYDIALGHLAPGLYFVSVQSEDKRMVKKLVVE